MARSVAPNVIPIRPRPNLPRYWRKRPVPGSDAGWASLVRIRFLRAYDRAAPDAWPELRNRADAYALADDLDAARAATQKWASGRHLAAEWFIAWALDRLRREAHAEATGVPRRYVSNWGWRPIELSPPDLTWSPHLESLERFNARAKQYAEACYAQAAAERAFPYDIDEKIEAAPRWPADGPPPPRTTLDVDLDRLAQRYCGVGSYRLAVAELEARGQLRVRDAKVLASQIDEKLERLAACLGLPRPPRLGRGRRGNSRA